MAVVVAQLVERLLPTFEVRGSNPVIVKIHSSLEPRPSQGVRGGCSTSC